MTSREATGFWARGTGAGLSAGSRAVTAAFALVQWPWLLNSLWGGPRAEKAALLARLGLPDDALPNLGSWKADTFFLHRIVDRIETARPAEVLELGCGATSLVTARALALFGGGRLTSLDSDADFVAATRAWLAAHGLEADIRFAPLGQPPGDWPGLWYQPGSLPDRIDLLLVDGPHWTLHPFVRGSAEVLFDRMAPGGMVMVDDAARPGERVVAARWAKRWPGFRWARLSGGTKGLLVGVREG